MQLYFKRYLIITLYYYTFMISVNYSCANINAPLVENQNKLYDNFVFSGAS